MHRGYIKLWRCFQDSPFWKKQRVFSKAEAWIDILFEIQHDEHTTKVMIGITEYDCNKGESLNSIKTWGNRWNWSRSKVKRFLNCLEKRHMIVSKSDTKTTHLKVCNYDIYNPTRTSNEHQTNIKRTSNEHQTNTDKNVKNVKNVKNKESNNKRFVPPTLSEANEYCQSLKAPYLGQSFIDHHSARGWVMSNRQVMKDWKAAMRTWIANDKRFHPDKYETKQWIGE